MGNIIHEEADVEVANQPEAILPALTIRFDPVPQSVVVQFDPKDFRSFEFIIGLLEMAKEQMKATAGMARVAQMQGRAMEQMQHQAVAQSLRKNGRH